MCSAHAKSLHDWLVAERSAGRRSWATAPRPGRSRCCARREVDRTLLPAVVDASPAKQGLRMPGTDIPVASPAGSPRAGRTRSCCSSRTCWLRSGRPSPRWRPRAAGGSMPRHLARLRRPAVGRGAGPGTARGSGRCCRWEARARRRSRRRHRRIGHQHLEQPLPPPRQAGQRSRTTWARSSASMRSSTSGSYAATLVSSIVIVAEHHPLTRRQAAQALVPRGRRQPGAHPIRVLDAVDVLEQAQPGGLGDVSGVALPSLNSAVMDQMSLAN